MEFNITYKIYKQNNSSFKCTAYIKSKQISECKITTDKNNKQWKISAWYTNDEYKNHGIGTKTMQKLIIYMYDKYNKPDKIEYIWNGENSYVLEWLQQNFNAICECPIAIQKTAPDDDWTSHLYTLNINKVEEYFLNK